MIYGDFLGFPERQKVLVSGEPFNVSPNDMPLDFCGVTVAPPNMRSTDSIVAECHRMRALLEKNPGVNTQFVYGLQNAPEHVTSHDLMRLRKAGIRFMSLAYCGPTEYGGGFAVPEERLSTRGYELLDEMATTKMVLDLSHVGHKTARDALDCNAVWGLSLKVVATHSGCYSVYSHLRNLPDDVLCDIADLGGIVGIPIMTWMFDKERNDIHPLLDHIRHAVNVCGVEHVAIGSDAIYRYGMTEAEERENHEFMENMLVGKVNHFHARFPDRPEELKGPDRFEVLAKLLDAYGFKNSIIEGIVGGNLARFLGEL